MIYTNNRQSSRIKKKSWVTTNLIPVISLLGFFLIFPGFLFYHYGISSGWWGSLVSGFFGINIAIIVFLSFLVLLRRELFAFPKGIFSLLVFGLFVYMIVWSFVGWLGIESIQLATEAVIESIVTLMIWIAVLFIGVNFPTGKMELVRFSNICVVITLLCFVHAFYDKGFPLGPYIAFGAYEDGEGVTYQGIGRSLLTIGLVAAFATKPNTVSSLGILFVTLILLLTLGSRAHFFAVVLSIAFHLGVLTAVRRTRSIGITGIFVVIILITFGINVFLETRASEIINVDSSTSWLSRVDATADAMQIISNYPIAGDFGYHLVQGITYAHNALSAWTQYGLIGFIAFSVTMLYSLYIGFAGLVNSGGKEPAWHLALIFSMIAILLAVVSEPIMSSVFPALAWGFTIRAQRINRYALVASRG
jgi:hypothetical protein